MIIIKLDKPHTHAGVDYLPGETITVDEVTAKWLIGQQVGHPVPKEKSKKGGKP